MYKSHLQSKGPLMTYGGWTGMGSITDNLLLLLLTVSIIITLILIYYYLLPGYILLLLDRYYYCWMSIKYFLVGLWTLELPMNSVFVVLAKHTFEHHWKIWGENICKNLNHVTM